MKAARYSLGPLALAGIVAVLSQSLYMTIVVGVLLWVAFLIAFGLDRHRRFAIAAILSGVVGVAWFGFVIPASFSDGQCGVDGATVYCPGLADAYALGFYGVVGAGLVFATALAALYLRTWRRTRWLGRTAQ